jgi:hypothetical protein
MRSDNVSYLMLATMSPDL